MSPLQQLKSHQWDQAGVHVYVKRDDLIQKEWSGNKYRKLKFQLLRAQESNLHHIVSCGGAYSNHLFALSQVARKLNFQVTMYIRGEVSDQQNPILQYARDSGVHLIPMKRSEYRAIRDDGIFSLADQHPDAILIPEGGTNALALQGMKECAEEITIQLGHPPDYCFVGVGTGGSLAGLVQGFTQDTRLIGVPSFAGPVDQTIHYVKTLLKGDYSNWEIKTSNGFGRFAEQPPELIEIVRSFYDQHRILLDPIYTSRVAFEMSSWVDQANFEKEISIVFVHTGGLQGWAGVKQRLGVDLKIDAGVYSSSLDIRLS